MDKVLQLKSLTLDYFSNVFVRFYLATQTLFRIALCIFAISRSQISLDEIPVILINGFVVDFISTFFVLPLVVVLQNFNAKILSKILPISNILSFIACIVFAGILVFSGVAQICFWDEFSTNFNFIAVDYLIYTHEIIGTLKDSMPLYEILSIVIMSSCFVGIWIYQASSRYKVPSIKLAVAAFFVAITAGSKYNFEQHFLYNKFATEIAKNGPYEFISAFYNSSLDYTKFYPLVGDDEALNFVRRKLSATNSTFVDDNSVDRNVIGNKALKKRNVILITVESLSAEYLTYFGNKNNITPYLDELASSGMLFTNIYATGTRTVRGLEALTLGIPPLPGESIIKRPNNHGFTLLLSHF
jgi:phosphoglycerol transferase MdoB-like AlkP superfamily enzyme